MTPAPKNLREALERVRAVAVGRLADRLPPIDAALARLVDDICHVRVTHLHPHGAGCGWEAIGALAGPRASCMIAVGGDLCGDGISFVSGPWETVTREFDPAVCDEAQP